MGVGLAVIVLAFALVLGWKGWTGKSWSEVWAAFGPA